MSSGPRISVVVPTVRLNDRLRACIEHLGQQTYRDFDVYVVTDEPESFTVEGLDVHFLASGPVLPNHKRLQAAQASRADIIALIDDDAYPAEDWLATAARHFADRDVVAAGGPGVTPPEDGPSQRVSGAIYASPLVSAGQARRYVPQTRCDVDLQPSCNLLVRRDALIAAAPHSLAFSPGEDALLCMHLRRSGGRIVYDPSALVYHHRRPLFWGHFAQVWSYAVQRGHFAKHFPAMTRDPTYLVPPFFVAGNLAFGLWALEPAAIRFTFAALFVLYAALVGWEARRAQRIYRVHPLAVALGIYLTHLTYGAGVAYGFAGLRQPRGPSR